MGNSNHRTLEENGYQYAELNDERATVITPEGWLFTGDKDVAMELALKHLYQNKRLTFDEYNSNARKTAVYPDAGSGNKMSLTYTILGLNGEAGEVAEVMKKQMRGQRFTTDKEFRESLMDELSDVLWYLAAVCRELNIPLSTIAKHNINKLQKRRDEGTLKSR